MPYLTCASLTLDWKRENEQHCFAKTISDLPAAAFWPMQFEDGDLFVFVGNVAFSLDGKLMDAESTGGSKVVGDENNRVVTRRRLQATLPISLSSAFKQSASLYWEGGIHARVGDCLIRIKLRLKTSRQEAEQQVKKRLTCSHTSSQVQSYINSFHMTARVQQV